MKGKTTARANYFSAQRFVLGNDISVKRLPFIVVRGVDIMFERQIFREKEGAES